MPDYAVHLSTFLRFLELHIFYSGNEVDVNGEAVIPSKVGCNFFESVDENECIQSWLHPITRIIHPSKNSWKCNKTCLR